MNNENRSLTIKSQAHSQTMQQHEPFNSSAPQTPLSGALRKRKTYDGRQKGLEGVSGSN